MKMGKLEEGIQEWIQADNGASAPSVRSTDQKKSPLPSLKMLTEHFEFLDKLRKSGATNMFGAGPWLERAFGMRERAGSPIVSAWMKTFSHEPAEVRAQKARNPAS